MTVISRQLAATLILTLFITGAQIPSALAQARNEPPYEGRLLRLSEIIGSIHFLTLLCRPDDGLIWFEKMEEMLEVEASTELRKAKLIERFNAGFDSFQSTYRRCTPASQTALARYISEASLVVQNLTSDFSR